MVCRRCGVHTGQRSWDDSCIVNIVAVKLLQVTAINCTGALELLASSKLPADYYDWECGKIFRFVKAHEDQVEAEADDEKEQAAVPEENAEQELTLGRPVVNPTFQAADVSIPFQLTAADNFRTPFTNYVRG